VVEFSADQITYDSENDIVTATGQVRMDRDGNYLAADRVVWTRKTGQIRAEGNVVVVDPQGDQLVGDNVALTDTLRDGVVNNLLIVLESGGRIAAQRGTRSNGVITLENAAYSPCPVTSESGCPSGPGKLGQGEPGRIRGIGRGGKDARQARCPKRTGALCAA